MRHYGWLISIMAGILILDQGSKVWVRAALAPKCPYCTTNLIPHLLDLTYSANKGISFGFLGELGDAVRVPLLVTVSIVAVGLLGWYWVRHRSEMNRWHDLAFAFILPGAVGNLIDRMWFGTVTDFFHFRFYTYSFFINNFADIFISLGVVAYLAGMFRKSMASQ